MHHVKLPDSISTDRHLAPSKHLLGGFPQHPGRWPTNWRSWGGGFNSSGSIARTAHQDTFSQTWQQKQNRIHVGASSDHFYTCWFFKKWTPTLTTTAVWLLFSTVRKCDQKNLHFGMWLHRNGSEQSGKGTFQWSHLKPFVPFGHRSGLSARLELQ